VTIVASHTGAERDDVAGSVKAVSCHDLVYSFGERLAVDHVSLEVEVGEVFGLLGPNGAGKTTTIRILTTLLPLVSGRAEIFGLDVGHRRMAARRVLGYVPQQLSADAALTGRENVALFARLYDVPRGERRSRVEEALAHMGLSDSADRLASTYSGGMIRRLELAQALVNRPRLLVLDEPTIGLDPLARTGVWERVLELCESTGMTVLLTTHYMEEAEELCDRVALMHLGRLQAVGTPAALEAELGEAATLQDVFAHHTGSSLDDTQGGYREARRARRTASRLG
jgi:ABC-2 type transport system ATP-binding protein